MFLMNATKEEQTIKALGNWFTFKPGQVKQVNDDLGHWITTMKAESGLVSLPDAYEDPEYKNSPEGKAAIEEARERGVKAYVDFHRSIVANNQVSLRRDLGQANIQADPAIYATQGELNSMRIVAAYQKAADDAEQKKVDEVRELMKKVQGK